MEVLYLKIIVTVFMRKAVTNSETQAREGFHCQLFTSLNEYCDSIVDTLYHGLINYST